MITAFGFFIIFCLFLVIFLTWKRPFNVILSWILSQLVKKIFPHEHLQITVEDFGYFCANGVSVQINKNRIVRIEEVVLEFLWEEFRLKLQSTAKDIKLVTRAEKSTEQNQKLDEVVIKGFVTVGVNLYSFNPPTELLCIAPESEHVHGSDINISELTSVWLFARNVQATIQGKLEGENAVSYDLLVSEGSALLLYNSNIARVVLLIKNAFVTCSPNINPKDSGLNTQVANSEGLILVYKFEDGVLTSSHSRLKHTEINLTSSIISNLEDLVTKYVNENLEDSLYKEKNLVDTKDDQDDGISSQVNEEKCEVAMEAESITMNMFSSDRSKHFELKLAFISLGCPYKNTVRWSVSIPFEIIFVNDLAGGMTESVLGSKIKSEGLVNPCVLKLEGEVTPNQTTRWDVSTHEGILFEIKPEYVNTLETFIKYKSRRFPVNKRNSAFEDLKKGSNMSKNDVNNDPRVALEHDVEEVKSKRQRMFAISASICDMTIDVKDTSDKQLMQVVMVRPKFSLSQDHETRSLSFRIETLKGFNCLKNMPFFHPTEEINDDGEKAASLELCIKEKLTSHEGKYSFENFSFGSCDTTVVVEETLLFAVLKHFGFHQKVARIFFENREEENAVKTSSLSKRFYFENVELRAVEVILTLLPAIDLPVELKVIKNSLGIPHQLPPRVENACLYFDAFLRNNIQYGSYKYISYDIKKHYLKELGSQSARVLGSMHLLGNISRLKQDIMSGFTTLRETGEFITFFRQVTTGVASSYSKFAGSWSDLFGLNSPNRSSQETQPNHERRHSDPSDLEVAILRQLSNKCTENFQVNSTPRRKSKDDNAVLDVDEASEGIWLHSTIPPDVTDETDGLNWDTESSDGEGTLGIPLDLIPQNVKRQLKGQEFLRRLKENIGDNEHGEVFACCFKVRKNVVETKLNALLSNRKVYFLKGRPSQESLVLCVKYETLYKAQYIFQDKTHYLQLMSKMKGIRTLSIPSRTASESPLVRCDNMVIARRVSTKINELKRTYDQEYMHSQHQ